MLNSFPFVAYQRLKVIAIANSHSAKLTPFTRNSVAFQRSSAAITHKKRQTVWISKRKFVSLQSVKDNPIMKEEYRPIESEPLVAAEPVVAYGNSYVQGLKQRLKATIDQSNDEESLQQCLEVFYAESMPCMFSKEELGEEIRLSEKSGEATEEEVESIFRKWLN